MTLRTTIVELQWRLRCVILEVESLLQSFTVEDLRAYHAHQYTRLPFNPYSRWDVHNGDDSD